MRSKHTPKEKIKDAALLVSSKLDSYLKLHASINKNQGTLLSFFKNLFGKPVPFSQFIQQAKELEEEFKLTIKNLNSTKKSIANEMSKDERKFMDCLLEYAKALSEAIATLKKRQEVYLKNSKEYKNMSANLSLAKAMEKQYQEKNLHYQKIGEKLTKLNHVIFQ